MNNKAVSSLVGPKNQQWHLNNTLTIWPSRVVPVGQPIQFNFTLTNQQTNLLEKQLEVVHTKPVHMFFIRDDLEVFLHEHPQQLANGQWQVTTTLPDAGRYQIFAQYKPLGQAEQTRQAIVTTVPGQQRIPTTPTVDTHLPKFIGPYEFRIQGLPSRSQPESHYQLQVRYNGQPVTNIQPYLGAGGHSVIANMGAQDIYHVHPMSAENQGQYQSPLTFHTNVSSTGLHKVWTQVKINGQIYTTDWTFNI